jgi:hypothetical protein
MEPETGANYFQKLFKKDKPENLGEDQKSWGLNIWRIT